MIITILRALVILLLIVGLVRAVLDARRASAQTTVTVLPMVTRPGGTSAFTAINVPTGIKGVQLVVDVSQASDPLPGITGLIEGSIDGGVTWMPAGGFSRDPGPKVLNKAGVLQTTMSTIFFGGTFWSDVNNPNRQLRGVVTITSTLRFSMTVTTL